MDTIRLEIGRARDEPRTAVDVFINGRNLLELVREVELPFWTAEGHPEQDSQYDGLPPEYVFLPSRHLLDEPNGVLGSNSSERVPIYIHSCGEPGCWPLQVQIELHDGKVVWKNFRQPHRSRPNAHVKVWDYSGLGPFVFDRQQYEAELDARGRSFEPTWTELEGIEVYDSPPPVDRYWEQFLASLPKGARRYPGHADTIAFGMTWDDARMIAPLVLNGTKTSSGTLVWSNEADGTLLSRPGDLRVVLAEPDKPVCVIETTDVRVIPYDEVPEEYAWEGGEGDRSPAHWRKMYWEYIEHECKRIGREPSPKAPIAMERFRVIYAEPWRDVQSSAT